MIADPAGGELADGVLEEGGRRRAVVILQYLDIGQAGRIIDGDVDELPANATDAGASVAPDAVAHLTDSTKLLGVEMHKITWALADASANWFRRRQRTRSAKTGALEPASHGRSRHAHPCRDLLAGDTCPSQLDHPLDQLRRAPAGDPLQP